MKTKKMILEVCANSVQSALNAQKGGAGRIELCQNLNEGGTTPSLGTIRYCTENLHIPVFVLIRLRSGNFCYSDAEFEVIKKDVALCKENGVSGVVVGFLHEDLSVDCKKTQEIVRLAFPMEVTFHRAFDISRDWRKSLQEIIACGCRRILSSGCRKTALEGSDILYEMQSLAKNQITILAGSGITPQNVKEIIFKTGVNEVHSSCKGLTRSKTGRDIQDHDHLPDQSNYEWMETKTEIVKEMMLNGSSK